MPVIAEVVDAAVGGDTHRDIHALEMVAPNGATIATIEVTNDSDGFVAAIGWLVEHAPGPQLVIGLEGTRSYGIGLARALPLKDNKRQLLAIVESIAPALMQRVGVGPVSAAQAMVSWSHHGRCRNEAAFAALAGSNPIPASSGRVTRHRLNRGGDRQLNRSLHDMDLLH
jgi:transposase